MIALSIDVYKNLYQQRIFGADIPPPGRANIVSQGENVLTQGDQLTTFSE